jgi:hypothetical protein
MRHFRLWKLFLGLVPQPNFTAEAVQLSISRCPVVQDLESSVKIELDEMREHETKRDEIEAAEIARHL